MTAVYIVEVEAWNQHGAVALGPQRVRVVNARASSLRVAINRALTEVESLFKGRRVVAVHVRATKGGGRT